MEGIKVLNSTWSTNRDGTIGFVLYETEYGEKQLRCSKVNGNSTEEDIEYVVEWGSLVPFDLKEMIEEILYM